MNNPVFLKIAELVKSGEASLQTGPFGTQLKASDYVEHGVPVINVRNIGFGDIRQDNLEFLNEVMTEKMSAHKLKRGDIVFGRKGAVERHAFIKDIGVGWIQGSDCLRLRINSDRIDNQFVSYFFKTHAHQDWMQAVCSFGATMASLNQDIVKLITIPLPPLDVQRKIAGILSAYDDLIENNKRRIALLEGMAEEIYREWFVRFRFPGWREAEFEKGIPKGWEIKTIGDVYKTASGGTPSRKNQSNYDGDINWLKTGELKNTFAFESEEKITVHGLESSSTKVFPAGTVVIAMYCAMPDITILGEDAATNQACCAFLPKKKYFGYPYTYYLIKFSQNEMIQFSHGAAQQNLSQDLIKGFKLLVASEDLIKDFSSQVTPIFDEIKSLFKANENLVKTKNALLPRLISGKLAVEDLAVQLPPSMREEGAVSC